jgi:hypothetical protein
MGYMFSVQKISAEIFMAGKPRPHTANPGARAENRSGPEDPANASAPPSSPCRRDREPAPWMPARPRGAFAQQQLDHDPKTRANANHTLVPGPHGQKRRDPS